MVDNTEVNWVENYIVRGILGRALDNLVYWLLGFVYQIFFNVASAELFTNETVKNFYGRVQLILGVFMIFKIAVSIIKGIVSPDSFTDKGKGMGNIVTRIIFTLVMLTIIVPINIPNAQTEYEIQLNNNGLLFGTLYSLQNRILSNNTIGRLVLGTTDGMSIRGDSADLTDTNKKLKESANVFTSTILKGFIRINIIDEEKEETDSSNWVCKDTLDQDVLDVYTDLAANPSEIIALTTLKCDAPGSGFFAKIFNTNERYAFAYKYLISAIVGIVFIFIMVSLTVDVAVRAIKLAILRLVAPIPIISYMDPAGESKFKKWTSVLTATYVDLFIRLAVIYFVIFLIQDIIVHGLVVNRAKGVVGVFTYIFIFIGLFVFAKKAPKFLKDLFDMKGEFSLFDGLGEMVGLGTAAAGAVGAGVNAYRTQKEQPNSNVFKNIVSGISNGAMAFGAGTKASLDAKDHKRAAAFDAIQKRNAIATDRIESGSTVGSRMGTYASRLWTGQSPYEADQKQIAKDKAIAAAGKDLHSYLEDRAVKKGGGYGIQADYKDAAGNTQTLSTSYDEWINAWNTAKQNGATSFTVKGHTFDTHGSTANALDGDLKSAAAQAWVADTGGDSVLADKVSSYTDSGGTLRGNDVYDANKVKTDYRSADGRVTKTERSAAYAQHKADHGESNKK